MKIYQQAGLAVAAIAITTAASVAFAQSAVPLPETSATTASSASTTLAFTYPAVGSTPAPMVIEGDDSGAILIRGIVIGVGSDSLTIESWGGPWTIRTGESILIPDAGSATGGSLSGISIGDFIGVDGTVSANAPYTIDAALVRDWTRVPAGATISINASGVSSQGSSTASVATTSLSQQPFMGETGASSTSSLLGSSGTATSATSSEPSMGILGSFSSGSLAPTSTAVPDSDIASSSMTEQNTSPSSAINIPGVLGTGPMGNQ